MFDHFYPNKPTSMDAAYERGAIQAGFMKQEDVVFPENKTCVLTPMTQPPPLANNNPAVWSLVQMDMLKRNEFGRQKYGVQLQPFNGRDVLQDAYEEALDLVVYLRQAIYERDNKNA